jgi:hypothetical protein
MLGLFVGLSAYIRRQVTFSTSCKILLSRYLLGNRPSLVIQMQLLSIVPAKCHCFGPDGLKSHLYVSETIFPRYGDYRPPQATKEGEGLRDRDQIKKEHKGQNRKEDVIRLSSS